ncbi:DUF4190 domain-containing protein [Streptomyces sp. NPDC008121]|uniref:DUF4190 domain-containing protein n=1 Tax=Streptomyces sp. NPDC008121 TaxID=3364809 RepID=UPI0036EB43EC
MSDNSDQPQGGYDPADPWAPPNRDGVELGKPATPPVHDRPPVHDQPTMTAMPTGEDGAGQVPPPPVAPGGPAAAPGTYGYPTAPTPPTAPGGTAAYGYPAYPAYGSTGYGQTAYGQAPYGAGPYGATGWQQAPSNGMGTAALVLGIISVVGICLYGIQGILGILALIFGIIGVKKAGRGEATNRGMAIAGIVLGSIGILIAAAFLVFFVWAIQQDPSTFEEDPSDPFATSLVTDGR